MFSLRDYVQEHMSEYRRYYGRAVLVYINKERVHKRICKDESEALSFLPKNTLFDRISDYEIITIPLNSLRVKHRRKIR